MKRTVLTASMIVLLSCWLPGERLHGQEPEPTAEQQKLLEEAKKLNAEGAKLYQQAKLPEATERLRKALELCELVYPKDKYKDGHPDLAKCINNLAFLVEARGEYAQAEPLFRRALQMTEALYPKYRYPNGHSDLAQSLNNLAGLLKDQGEYAQAELLYRRALQMKEALYPKDRYPNGHPDLAICVNDLAGLLRAQGEYAQAEPLFRRALQMYEALYPKDRYPNGHPDLARSFNNLAVLLKAQGEYAQAEPLYRRALEMREALYPKDRYPNGHPDLAHSLNTLAILLDAQGEYAKAEPLYRRALQMNEALYSRDRFPNGHPELARSLNNLAVLLRMQGEYAQAELLCRRALQMREALYPRDRYSNGHRDLARSLNDLARLLLAQGEYAQAEPLYRRALQMYRQHAEHLASHAPEAVALNHAATFPMTCDGLLSVTWHVPDADARTYAALWASKAALTRVFQRRHLALLAASTDPRVRDDWGRLQQLRRRREYLIMTPVGKGAALRDQKLKDLDEEVDQLEKDLLLRLPALKHFEDLATFGPDALQKRLPAGAVLADFLRYTQFEYDPKKPGRKGEKRTVRYLAFLISRDSIQRVELGTAAEIDEAIAAWREAITLKPGGGNVAALRDDEIRLARQGERVRKLVWQPLVEYLGKDVRTLYLAPDAALTQVPWAALPIGKDHVLLEDYAVAVLPHGPFLLEQLLPPPPRRDQRPPAAQELLLVGGIRYDDQPAVMVAGSRAAEEVVAQKVTYRSLPGMERERQLLAQMLEKSGVEPRTLGGSEASTARLRQALAQARYAHLATHGFFADKEVRSLLQLDEKLFARREFLSGDIGERIGAAARSPLVLSGLVCAGANRADTPERGILSADAIAGLLLDDLELAVLSACDTGLGDVAGGEGVFGLQRAFHIAGCRNVVASLWKVDDAATAALMTRFYGYLFAADKDQPLSAMEALRRAQLDLYRHPELIPAWSRGEARAPGAPRPATTPPPADTPPELVTSAGRSPLRLWAAFVLSGTGR
jgi:CHAT domain-containing protein/Tfp pilus assembly protein PilF